MLASCELLGGQAIKGVLYSDQLGNGRHPAGIFVLAVDGRRISVSYGEPLGRVYKSTICNDIGAEWMVDVAEKDGTYYANRVTCIGKVDSQVHVSFNLARDWIVSAARGIPTVRTLSAVYRSSDKFRQLKQEIDAGLLKYYFDIGQLQKCIEVVEVRPYEETSLRTHCALKLDTSFVSLQFVITRNPKTGTWEIKSIDVD